jgi:hypothetical protein
VKISINRRVFEPEKRRPALVSLGCHVEGVACPHPDLDDPHTAVAGVLRRVAYEGPKPNRQLLRQLRRFCYKWCRKKLKPIPADADLSVEHWLEQTDYPLWRKTELLEKWKKINHIDEILDPENGYLENKSFCKDEVYPEYKHARIINSRSDEFKCAVGPIFKYIDKELFKQKAFIKKIPVSERPQYITDRLYMAGAEYAETDYSSFEAQFKAQLMKNCEFVLYSYMTQNIHKNTKFMQLISKAMLGKNKCVLKFITFVIQATRMSGEMCTSSGNGFSNLMFMKFLGSRRGIKVKGVVEGDDGLNRLVGGQIPPQDFINLGLTVKLKMHSRLEEASFCGMIFDREEKINITNPKEVLSTFGWTSSTYALCRDSTHKKLLRCKALSLLYQYRGCPILTNLAIYGLRVTRSIDVRDFVRSRTFQVDSYKRSAILDAVNHEKELRGIQVNTAGPRTRLLVEKMYGISITEQLRIEAYLDSLEVVQPLKFPTLIFPRDWTHYYVNYSRNVALTHIYRPGGFVKSLDYRFPVLVHRLAQRLT